MDEGQRIDKCAYGECPLFREAAWGKNVRGYCAAFKQWRGIDRRNFAKEGDLFPNFCPIEQRDELGIVIDK